jgi:hypothetical protein
MLDQGSKFEKNLKQTLKKKTSFLTHKKIEIDKTSPQIKVLT